MRRLASEPKSAKKSPASSSNWSSREKKDLADLHTPSQRSLQQSTTSLAVDTTDQRSAYAAGGNKSLSSRMQSLEEMDARAAYATRDKHSSSSSGNFSQPSQQKVVGSMSSIEIGAAAGKGAMSGRMQSLEELHDARAAYSGARPSSGSNRGMEEPYQKVGSVPSA
eukprot:1901657-Amphidinium_carterae.1